MKLRSFSLFICTLLCAVPAIGGGNGDVRKAVKKIPDHYIVVLEGSVESEEAASELAYLHGGRLDKVFKHALKGFSIEMSEGQAKKLAKDSRVAYVEEDAEIHLDATQSNATWGLDRIDQRDLPLSTTYTYDYTGSGVKVYIIDTGIRPTHTEFGGRAVHGYSAINDGRGSSDCNGHGTHVAGTVGGAIYGVAKSVTLVAVRVLDCNGSGSTSGVIAGVDWVTADHQTGQPAAANMSLGGGASSSLDTAVRNSINDGVTYAIASGNSNANACYYSPARVAEAITVNSSTSSDARSSFSNWGSCTDIFAPGSSITSAWYSSDTATNIISGTSMATPHVAGVAALYLQSSPGASPATVWTAIRDTSTPNKITNPRSGTPNRLLYSLLSAAPPPPPPPPPPPSGGQLLLNPGFESGNVDWAADAGVITNSTQRTPRSGSWYAWLNGYGISNTDWLYQTVTIPSTATGATLNFYLKIDTAETTCCITYDKLQVQIRNTSNAVLQTLATYSNLNASSTYLLKSFDVLNYKGQTIRVYFLGTEDSSLQTSFLIDDTSLNVTTP